MGDKGAESREWRAEKTDSYRAKVTKRFLESKKVSIKDFCKMTKKADTEIDEADFNDDKTLVKKTKVLQSKIGLPEQDFAEGQDGMVGLVTFNRLKAVLIGKERREDRASGSALASPAGLTGDASASKAGDEPAAPAPAATEATAPAPAPSVEVTPSAEDVPGEPLHQNIEDIVYQFEGRREVVRLPGNGGRQVVIYIPEGFNPDEPAEIAYHFHGTNSQLVDLKVPPMARASDNYNDHVGKPDVGVNRLSQALGTIKKQVAQKTRNVILVYPLSAGRRAVSTTSAGYTECYDEKWMRDKANPGENMEDLHQQTLARINGLLGRDLTGKPKVTLSGHSAGGLAVANVLQSGFKPDTVKFLDATYGSWAQRAYDTKAGESAKFEFYVMPLPDKKIAPDKIHGYTDNPITEAVASRGKHRGNTKLIRDPYNIHDNFIRAWL